jgi:tRNA threonylcarbamoyladenosine biosynthesis protein TsaB
MPVILNIETATEVCSVALGIDGRLIDFKETHKDKSHASVLSLYIEEILDKNRIHKKNIDAIAVSKGPGSYTGLRIGVSTAKGLGYGFNIPLIGINTLETLANGLIEGHPPPEGSLLCPMLDAKRMEVYTALFDSKGKTILKTSAEIIHEHFFEEYLNEHTIFFFGNGALKCKDIIKHPNAQIVETIQISSKHMIHQSHTAYLEKKFENTAYFEPFYLKDFIATKPKNKLINTHKR